MKNLHFLLLEFPTLGYSKFKFDDIPEIFNAAADLCIVLSSTAAITVVAEFS